MPAYRDSAKRTGRTLPEAVCPVLVGVTAVGKTSLIVDLARAYPIEVISLDSRQIYHGMRVGTSQPTASEQAACRHHLVDFVDPGLKYTAGQYRLDFIRAYRDIHRRGRIPVVVGGAGLYLRALQEGLLELPGVTSDDTTRARAELQRLSDDAIRARLQVLDRPSWEAIHPHDRYRNQRAVEICILAGRPMSTLREEQQPQPALGLTYQVVLLQRPAAVIDGRIAVRTTAMLASGWIEETKSLLTQYGPEAPGLQAIGYRQIVAWLGGELPDAELEEKIVVATRQYAKRQRTWFRHIPTLARGEPEDAAILQEIDNLLVRAQAGLGGAGPQLA